MEIPEIEKAPKKSWLEKRTKMERYFLLIFSVLGVVIALLIVGLICLSTGKCSSFCLTEACVEAANKILKSIDRTVDPCDDFYGFVCGNENRNMVIPKKQNKMDRFGEIENDINDETHEILEGLLKANETKRPFSLIRDVYRACMNEDAIERKGEESLGKLLEGLGEWPVLKGDSWNEGSFAWTDFVGKLKKKGLALNYFLGFYVVIDSKNSSKHILELNQADVAILRDLLDAKRDQHYFNYMVEVAEYLGAERSRAEKELNESLQFEMKLVNVSLRPGDKQNWTELYIPITVRELQKNYTNTNWLSYINNLLAPEAQIDENEVIIVEEPAFLSALENLIKETPKRVQANYGVWRAIRELSQSSYLPRNLTELWDNFVNVVQGLPETEPTERWQFCSGPISRKLAPLLSSMYVRKYFDANEKANVDVMVEHLKNAFKQNLNGLEWMDEKTRQNALEKVENMGKMVAYPDELLNDTVLEDYYQELELNDKDDYLDSMLKIDVFQKTKYFRRLHQPTKRLDWTKHAQITKVGARNLPTENGINVPAGILRGSFYEKSRPSYMNYGAIGSIIGHEITHGFDSSGSQFGKDGNLQNWWNQETERLFKEKTRCIIDQYNNYTMEEINQKVNGFKTRNENIADNGGLKQAYAAYQAWKTENREEAKLPGLDYTPEQLFWISAGMNWCARYSSDEIVSFTATLGKHALEKFRVLGPFSNSEEFASDFNCEKGSRMNPDRKCSVW